MYQSEIDVVLPAAKEAGISESNICCSPVTTAKPTRLQTSRRLKALFFQVRNWQNLTRTKGITLQIPPAAYTIPQDQLAKTKRL